MLEILMNESIAKLSEWFCVCMVAFEFSRVSIRVSLLSLGDLENKVNLDKIK